MAGAVDDQWLLTFFNCFSFDDLLVNNVIFFFSPYWRLFYADEPPDCGIQTQSTRLPHPFAFLPAAAFVLHSIPLAEGGPCFQFFMPIQIHDTGNAPQCRIVKHWILPENWEKRFKEYKADSKWKSGFFFFQRRVRRSPTKTDGSTAPNCFTIINNNFFDDSTLVVLRSVPSSSISRTVLALYSTADVHFRWVLQSNSILVND